MQPSLLLLLFLFSYSHTVKPPGYEEQQKQDADSNPPKYEYGYNIIGDKGGEQGKQEQRDGIYAQGRYFVQNKDSQTDVRYFADDWGYHPAVEYNNVGPHSKSSAKFALGHEAVIQLKNKENNLPQLQGLPDTGPLKKENTPNTNQFNAEAQNLQPNLLLLQSDQRPYQEPQQQFVYHQRLPESPQQLVYPQQPISYAQPQQDYSHSTASPLIDDPLNNRRPNKLIASTQHLVTGQDVLDINQATAGPSTVTNYEEYPVKSTTPYSTITEVTATETNFHEQPIVAAELENRILSTTAREREQYQSTTASTLQAISTLFESSTATPTIVVTPKPISSTFFTPLLNLEGSGQEKYKLSQQNVEIEVQKTYSGKNRSCDEDVGQKLYYYPAQLPLPEVDNHITIQQLPSAHVENKFVELDQQVNQDYQHQVVFQQPYQQQVVYRQPNQQVIHQPYPVQITKYIEKPIPVPQPYPVERIVEKQVRVPVQVTKYVDRPYPVEVRVPYPVEKIVKQPYPVEVKVPVHIDRIVEKPVPQYVDRPYPVHIKVPVPTPVAVPVDRIVEKKIPVPHYIEKPVTVEKVVERPVPQYIDRPYPVEVKIPVPQPYFIKVEVPRHYQTQLPAKYIEKPYFTWFPNGNGWKYPNGGQSSNLNLQFQQNLNAQVVQTNSEGYHYPNPYNYAPQSNSYLPPKQEEVNREYLPPVASNCDHGHAKNTDNYMGLVPPKVEQSLKLVPRKYRSARSSFDEKTVKMEYGFKPPLVPSLEIDEFGRPVEKNEK